MKSPTSLLFSLFVCSALVGGAEVSCGEKWKETAGIPHSHNKPISPNARNLIAFGQCADKFEYHWVARIRYTTIWKKTS